jgi:hypothetical protein
LQRSKRICAKDEKLATLLADRTALDKEPAPARRGGKGRDGAA